MKYREDYFAIYSEKNGEKSCSALTRIDCKKCNFYRNDINRKDIESDIKKNTYNSYNKKGI